MYKRGAAYDNADFPGEEWVKSGEGASALFTLPK